MAPKPESIALELELNTRAAEKAAKHFGDVVKSSTNQTERVFDASQKSNFKAVSKFYTALTKGRKIVAGLDKQQKAAAKDYHRSLLDTAKQYKKVEREMVKAETKLRDLMLAEKDGSAARNKDHKEQVTKAKDRLKQLDEEKDALEKVRKTRLDTYEKVKDAKDKAREKFGLDTKGLIDAAGEAGSELVEPFKAMLNRDLETAMKSSGKLLGSTAGLLIRAAGKGVGKVLNRPGSMLKGFGRSLADRGEKRGGLGGLGMKGAGKGAEALGSLLKGVGPMMQSLGKLAPMLGLAAGALAGLVKMFLDADAHVKEFNKAVMESASTTGGLRRNMNNVGMATREMEADMAKLRDEAFTLDNVMRGLNKEDFTTVSASLGAQGLSLHTIANEFTRAQAAGENYAKVFASNTHMAVAYARQMNVPLQEIASFQGEMMTELGMSAGNVADSFALMERGAADAGVSSQRFFTMIKSVSSDLALYNTRLDETVHIMTLLSRVMSPRNAAKFMQTATQALRGMGRVQLLQTNLLGGGKGGKVVEKDLNRKAAGVSEQIARNGGKAGLSRDDLMKGNYEELLSGVADEQKGAIREAISEMRMDAKANKQGVFGSSMAMGNLGAGASLQVLKDSLNITGGGKLRDRSGDLGTQMLADKLGYDQKMLRGLAQFEESVDDQREWLKKNKDTDQGRAALKKAGLKPEDIDKADYDDILATMGADEQQKYKDMVDTRDTAQKQLDMTKSFNDKIQAFFDWFTTTFYNIVVGIYDTLSSLPGIGDGGKGKALSAAYKTRDQEVISAVEGSKGGKGDMVQRILGTGAGKALTQGLVDMPGQIAELAAKEQAAASGGDEVAARELGKQKDALIDKQREARQGIDSQLAGGADDADTKVTRLLDAAKKAGLSPEMVGKLDEQLRPMAAINGKSEDVDINKAAMAAGLNDQQLGQIYSQAAGTLDPRQLLSLMGTSSGPMGKAPTSPTGPAAQAATTTAAATEKQVDQQTAMGDTMSDIDKSLRQKGITIDKTQWKSRVQDQMDKGFLESLRTALYEYYLYKDVSLDQMQKAAQAGLAPGEVGSYVAERFAKGAKPGDAIESYQKNAEGGLVTGIVNGMAQVRRIPTGEGLASVGAGERIVPAGGGGGTQTVLVELSMKEDLNRLIDARASDVYARNKAAGARR